MCLHAGEPNSRFISGICAFQGVGEGGVLDKILTRYFFFFLYPLEPGDVIFTDQGFTIHEDLLQHSLGVGMINCFKEKLKRPNSYPGCISMSSK